MKEKQDFDSTNTGRKSKIILRLRNPSRFPNQLVDPLVDLYQSLHSNSASTTSMSPSISTTGASSILLAPRAPRKASPSVSDRPILRWIANPETQLCTRCPDKLLSLEDQSKSPRQAGRNSLISPEKRGVDCSQAGARFRSSRFSWFSWTPKLSWTSYGIPSEIGTRTCGSLLTSAWPWTHAMDPIEPSPLLRSNSRWRTYHRVRGAFSQLSDPLLIRLFQQAIQILTDESSFFCNLFHGRKR